MKKGTIKKIFSRFAFVGLTIVILFVLYFAVSLLIVWGLNALIVYFWPQAEPYVSIAYSVLSGLAVFITVLHAANRDMVPETKIPWILCIVALNIFGVALYATFSSHRPTRRARKFFRELHARSAPYEARAFSREEVHEGMGRWASTSEALHTVNPAAVAWKNTATEYLPLGERFLARLLGDLERAEKFIFLEYFIIERGAMFDPILEVLVRKAQAGVEVRLMYDDVGCMGKVSAGYYKKLRKLGIKCVKFNPFVPLVTNVHNNRDHRKITVIDGKIGYTGGLNLADEYINATHPFGHWKDVAVRLEGDGVRGLTLMFLQLYDLQTRCIEEFAPYFPEIGPVEGAYGFVQPYGDGPAPLYGRHLGEDVYVNLINGARHSLFIMTPYLIIDYRMREALVLAAQRGVDVRIITPHIPDKKVVFGLTRSNYMALIKSGAKIYEYTPGFIHAKCFLADGEIGVVGTINCDYRSFLYHFEDGVLLYGTQAVGQLAQDFEETFAVSALQTEEDAKRSVVFRWICELAKLFAPLF